MKFILLAAVAAIATPAIAQQQGSTGTDSPTTVGAQPRAGVNADGSAMPAQSTPETMQQTPTQGTMDQTTSSSAPTAGGYQPAQPPMAGPAPAGARVVFQQAPSVDQAYPAPAPKASYPPCKKGQTDGCTQRGGR